MTKYLSGFLYIICLTSCTFTFKKGGKIFVNQDLIVRSIQVVQPAEVGLSIQTTNKGDSTLIVQLTVDPKIPDDSLNIEKAKNVLSSFVTIVPDLNTFSFCKVIFTKITGSDVRISKSREFLFPLTPEVQTRVANYKDSARTSIGYIDTGWSYINKDLFLSLKLKPGWNYLSEEHDSLVDYIIGSDINELPQYRTDSDRKVTFRTLENLSTGNAYPILQLSREKINESKLSHMNEHYEGPLIFIGLVSNSFDSEDTYLKKIYELMFSKKITDKDLNSYHLGTAEFHGLRSLSQKTRDGLTVFHSILVKRFKSVTMMLTYVYSSEKELNEIKYQLSGLKINEAG